jgi:hypothetical protein
VTDAPGLEPAPGRLRRRARAVLAARHSPGHYTARSIYGAIIVLALLLTIQDHPPGPWKSAVLVAVTVLSVLAAEAYSDVLGMEVDLGVMVVVGVGPVLLFVLSAIGVMTEQQAFRVSVSLLVVYLFVAGFVTRRFSGHSVAASLRSALVIGGAGLLIAVVKQFAHG